MRETWALATDHWTLPLFVEFPGDDLASIRIGAGIHLLDCQRIEVEKFLESCGAWKSNNRWWLESETLKEIAKPSNLEPEQIVVWRPVQFFGENGVQDDFIEAFCQLGLVEDRVMAQVLWRAFCKLACSRLLNQQKPVDMLFCTLHAMPFRPNWKSVVLWNELRKEPGFRRGHTWCPPKARHEWYAPKSMEERKTYEHFLKPELTFYSEKEEHFFWSIEAAPTEMWYRMVKAVEHQRRRKHNPNQVSYFRRFREAVKRALPTALRLYKEFIDAVSKPYNTTRFSRASTTHRPSAIPAHPVPIASPDAPGWKGDTRTAGETNGRVSTLPHLQPHPENLRNEGRKVVKPSNQ